MAQVGQACLTPECAAYTSGPIGSLFFMSIQSLYSNMCQLRPNWPDDATPNLIDLNFDYIVVGAGTAGCIVASRLSEDPCSTVLLIEAGPDPPFESVITTGALLAGSPFDWQYKYEPDGISCLGSLGGMCSIPAGKMISGTHGLNGMGYVRGNRWNYDNLEAAGNIGWNAENALHYMKKSEHLYAKSIEFDPRYTNFHNYSGLLGVSYYDHSAELRENFIEAHTSVTNRRKKDISDLDNYGTVEILGTILNGLRESTAKCFLVPFRDRPNMKVIKLALALKVIFEGNVARGVLTRLGNGTVVEIRALKEVIISAGALNTPKLLMLSGVGPRDKLIPLNIPVISDVETGRNLHDHFEVYLVIILKKTNLEPTPNEAAFEVAEYLALGKGTWAGIGLSDINSFIRTDDQYQTQAPNVQISQVLVTNNSIPLPFCPVILGFSPEMCASILANKYDMVLLTVSVMGLQSTGIVDLASTNPDDPPKIYSNFLSNPQDIVTILKAIKIALRIVDAPSMRKIGAELARIALPACDCLEYKSDEYWTCYIRYMGQSACHETGTCKMAPSSDPNGVVDPFLQVYGTEKLRVVDASILPGLISGNTNTATMMVAEKGADMIRIAN